MPAESNKISYHSLPEHSELYTRGLPILAYHKIAARPGGVKWRSLYLKPRLFAQQMSELAAAGYSTATLAAPRPTKGNPARKFVLTFDDGYRSVLDNAAPVLARHGFQAIQFLVSSQIGGTNAWDVAEGEIPAPLMDREEVTAWLAAGHEIGAHTVSHERLTRLAPRLQANELRECKLRLEDIFGVPVQHLCYPYGDFDDAVAAAAAETGYVTACTLLGGVNLAATPSHVLRRIEARYPPRNLRALWRRLRRSLG